MSMNIGGFNAAPKYFQIQAGKLDQQAKAFILKNDTDKDGELSQAEVKAAGGLTPGIRSKVASASIAASLWAGVSGPSGGIGAKEYAQFLIALDFDQDGKITQDESDATTASWSKFIQANPTIAHQAIYAALVQKGNDYELNDKIQDNSEEEQLAEALANGKDPSSKPTPAKAPVTVDEGLPIAGGTTEESTPALVIPTSTTPVVNATGLPVVGGTTVSTTTTPASTTSGSLAESLKALPGLDTGIIASILAAVGVKSTSTTPAVETSDLPLVK